MNLEWSIDMRDKISHWYGALVAGPVSIITWIVSMGVFDLTTLLSIGAGILAFFISYIPTQQITYQNILNKYGITRSEHKYISSELKSAREKQKRLVNSYKDIRSFSDIKLVFEINRVVRAIIKKVEKNPKLFYQGLQFFHSNLDSAVNMTEMYLHLFKLPGKSKEEKIELHTTRLRLIDLKRSLELDLSEINKQDYDNLRFEGKVLKTTEDRRKKSFRLENKLKEQEIGQIKSQQKEREGETIDRN